MYKNTFKPKKKKKKKKQKPESATRPHNVVIMQVLLN